MSVQLKELIERIKKEGVGEADKMAEQIQSKAKEQADEIIRAANDKAREIVEKAEADAKRFENAGKEAVRQAGRDIVLKTEAEIKKVFASILNRETQEALKPELLQQAIASLVEAWAKNKGESIEVQVSENDIKNLSSYLQDRLSDEIKKGVTVKPSTNVESGFHVSLKDGSAFYDFSDRGLTEYFLDYLNPQISDALREGQD